MPSYSSIVRTLRIAVPAVAIFLLVLFFLWPTLGRIHLPKFDKAQISGDRTELVNPRYESKDDKGQRFLLTAERAIQVRATPDVVTLVAPTATMEKNDNSAGPQVTARNGIYENKSQHLQLSDDVMLITPQGDHFITSAADVDMKDKIVRSDQPVTGNGPRLDLTGRGFVFNDKEGLLTVAGPAKLVLHETTASTSPVPAEPGPRAE